MKLSAKTHTALPIESYLESISDRFKTGQATEHTYRPCIQEYLESVSNGISAINEPKRVKCGAPDFIILKKQLPIGYVETKDLGADLDEAEDSDQLRRYKHSLGNLILTNYLEFRWFVNGELQRKITIGALWGKKVKVDEEAFAELTSLLQTFIKIEIPTVKTAKDLGVRLAASAQIVRKLILEAYKIEDENGWLHKWKDAFSDVLIKNLKVDEFADMFAQTLAYGYFTARVHHTVNVEFSRFAAAKILPMTNPFLRQLFAEFAGVNMPDEISWAVDELVELLKRTDIEKVLSDFSENEGKEDPVVHFYETFLSEYNPELREKRGVYYTPSPIVEYIVASVDEILKNKFGRKEGLADEKTLILDPAVGTASFLYNIISKITKKFEKRQGEWDAYVGDNLLDRIFGFEILMAPYAVAHLKVGLKLQDTGYKFGKKQRLGVFLTDTLEAAARKSQEMLFNWISDEANAASAIKKDQPIMVVIGNPPYSGESENEGDWITNLMRGFDTLSNIKTSNYFECDGEGLGERNTKWINDDYVKFIRFAQWRITNTGHGVLAFVTNNGFLENPTFRGMRQALLKDFDELYILDLHGNSDKREIAPDGSVDENVFDIKRGVSISFLIRKENSKRETLGKVYRHDLWGTRENKYSFLNSKTILSTRWEEVDVVGPNYLLVQQDNKLKSVFESGYSLNEIFIESNVGIVTARDSLCIHFDSSSCHSVMKDFAKIDTEEAREKYKLGDDVRDWKVKLAQDDLIKYSVSESKIVPLLYRPFDIRHTFFTGNSKGIHCMPRGETMRHMIGRKNMALIATKQTKDDWGVWASNSIIGHKSYAAYDINSIFPLYFAPSEQTSMAENDVNIDVAFLQNLAATSGLRFENSNEWIDDEAFGPEAVYYYMLGFLNIPEYKTQFSDFLKREFPRVFIPDSAAVFKEVAKHGKELFELMTLNNLEVNPKICLAVKGSSEVDVVKYDKVTSRLYINKEQYFEGVSSDAFETIIGGFQPVERWLKDRKGKELNLDDLNHFKKLITAIELLPQKRTELTESIRGLGGFAVCFLKNSSESPVSLKVHKALKSAKEEKNVRKRGATA